MRIKKRALGTVYEKNSRAAHRFRVKALDREAQAEAKPEIKISNGMKSERRLRIKRDGECKFFYRKKKRILN